MSDFSTFDHNETLFYPLKTKAGANEYQEEEFSYQFNILSSVINATPDIIFYKDYLHHDGIYIGCNEAFAKFVGKPIEEIINRNDIELFGEELGNFFRTKDREMLCENMTRINEEWVTYPDGTTVLLSTSKTPFHTQYGEIIGLVGISRDITKLHEDAQHIKKQKQTLEDQKELYELVFKNTSSSVLIIDIEANAFIACNESAIAILKCDSQDDVLHLKPAQLSPFYQPDGRRSDEKSDEMNALAVEKGSHSFEWKHLKKTGEEFWVEVILTPIHLEGKKVLHVVWKDISEKKHAEKKLQEQQILLIQQSRFASKGEMIGNIAHQWRQPLNALGLIQQKLKLHQDRGSLDAQTLYLNVEKSMQLIHSMSSTIDDFRDFFNPHKEKTRFLIKDALKKAFTLVESSFSHHMIDYSVDIEDESLALNGYENEFSQVIVNLLHNAKDALTEKCVRAPKVSIHVLQNDARLKIKVCDNGGGIPLNIAEKIFDPYFTTKEEGKGTGIGLYMSKMIVEGHMCGKLKFQNTQEGACFSIKLRR